MIFLILRQLDKVPVKVGKESMPGLFGTVRVPLDPEGIVQVGGEQWSARCFEEDAPLPMGTRVQVIAVDGLKILVQPVSKEEG